MKKERRKNRLCIKSENTSIYFKMSHITTLKLSITVKSYGDNQDKTLKKYL